MATTKKPIQEETTRFGLGLLAGVLALIILVLTAVFYIAEGYKPGIGRALQISIPLLAAWFLLIWRRVPEGK